MDIVTAGPRLDRLFQLVVLDRCENLGRKSELLFVVSFAVIGVALSAAVEFGLSQVGLDTYEVPALLTRGVGLLFFLALVLAPLFETLLLQQLPIVIARRFGGSRGVQFLMGSVPFAVTHFDRGLASGVAAGVVGGSILSLTYLTFLPQSKSKAFIITAAVHALHNLAPSLMIARDITS